MGIDIFKVSNGSTTLPGNPIPAQFVIQHISVIGNFTMAHISYPHCTNYEGNKILIYEGDVRDALRSAKEIDPHFTDNALTPIARFAPSERGRKLAFKFCWEQK